MQSVKTRNYILVETPQKGKKGGGRKVQRQFILSSYKFNRVLPVNMQAEKNEMYTRIPPHIGIMLHEYNKRNTQCEYQRSPLLFFSHVTFLD